MLPKRCPRCTGTGDESMPGRWRCRTCGYTVPACRYWQSHEASPGEPCSYLDHLAIELHLQRCDVGWDMIQALRTLTLTTTDAEGLFARLTWLARNPDIRQPGHSREVSYG